MDQTVPFVAVTTTIGAADGRISGTLVSQIRRGKPDLTMTINGILAGLDSVTAGCDEVSMAGAWIMGFIGGALVVWSVGLIDSLQIDDPVGAFSVHGTCGIWGTLAVGLFNTEKGLFYGHGFGQLGAQIIGVITYGVFAALTSWILWSIIGGLFGGIRVTETEEIKGLDIGEHGMEAYPDFAASAK